MDSIDRLPHDASPRKAFLPDEEWTGVKVLTPAGVECVRTLLRDHRNEVYRFACSIATDHDCAEDLTQRAFLALLERSQIWDSRSEVRAFLFHVVRKRVLKAARRRATHARLQGPARDVLYQIPPTPDRMALGEEEAVDPTVRAALQAALDSLPPRRREALVLARFHGLSHAEIARKMDLSPQTVANHVSLALRDLRNRLRSRSRELGMI